MQTCNLNYDRSQTLKTFLAKMICLGICLFLLSGCAHYKQFYIKAIDAQTEAPLNGVTTTWRQNRSDLFRGPASVGPTSLPASRADGVIKFNGVISVGTWGSSFIFVKPGYETIYGYYRPGVLNVSENADNEQEFSFLEPPIRRIIATNGCFVIAIPRKEPSTLP